MIETLDPTSRAEIVAVFGEAFSDHPLMSADPTGRTPRFLANAILDAFSDAPEAQLFGIRRNGRLDCAALVFDASYEPRGFRLLLFLIRMIWAVGWRTSRTFGEVLSKKPRTDERRLELMVLGTRADCQKQGLGRALIRHIFEFAHGRGYESVVLETAKETPAFGFYLREGFLVDREIPLPTTTFCMLRRPL
jgi:ribosomal protein S18 acetylase RimI-like enzyme